MHESVGAEGDIAAEGVSIEGDFKAVVVAFAAYEGEDVVGGGVARQVQQLGGGVEGDGDGVRGDGACKGGRGGIGAPVDGIDGETIAIANHGNGTTVVADGVVADGDAEVGTILCGTEAGRGHKVTVGDAPANDVGSDHAAVDGGVDMFKQVDHSQRPLAETGEDEGSPLVETIEIVGKGAMHVSQSQRCAHGHKAVGGKGLEGALAVVGGVVVEVAAEDFVNAFHLAVEEGTDAVVVGVGIVAGKAGKGVVARFGGDDVEDVDRRGAVGDVPLRSIGIDGRRRDGGKGSDALLPTAGDKKQGGDSECQGNGKFCVCVFYNHSDDIVCVAKIGF